MRYLEFNLLSEINKMKEIWENGVLVAEHRVGHYRYELFQIGDFYAEQQIHIHYNIRNSIRTFKPGTCLDPYLALIDISGLFKEYN